MRYAALLLGLLFAFAAHAQETVTAASILSGDELALQDGRILRLAGIKAEGAEAKTYLKNNIKGHALLLQNATVDRYGRVEAVATLQGSTQSIEEEMLGQGLAFVYPAIGDDQADTWLVLEKEARQKRSGIWGQDKDISSHAAFYHIGSYQFVVDTVMKAERIKNKVYLSFGEEKPHFTLIIAAHFLRSMKKRDMDWETLQGKRLRVRGWIEKNNGAAMTLTDLHQIEFAD